MKNGELVECRFLALLKLYHTSPCVNCNKCSALKVYSQQVIVRAGVASLAASLRMGHRSL